MRPRTGPLTSSTKKCDSLKQTTNHHSRKAWFYLCCSYTLRFCLGFSFSELDLNFCNGLRWNLGRIIDPSVSKKTGLELCKKLGRWPPHRIGLGVYEQKPT